MRSITQSSLFALVLTFSTACGVGFGPKRKSEKEHSYDTQTINHLKVTADSGDVEIVPAGAEPGKVEFVKRTPKYRLTNPQCETNFSVDGDTMHVRMKSIAGSNCDMTARILLKPDTTIDIETGSGDVSIKEMLSPSVKVRQGSGDLTMSNLATNIDAETGSGDMRLDLYTTEDQSEPGNQTKIKSGSGDLQINYAFAPAHGRLDGQTGSGDIKVKLPTDSKFSLTSERGSGDLSLQIEQSAAAKMHLELKTGSGDIKIVAND